MRAFQMAVRYVELRTSRLLTWGAPSTLDNI